MSYEPIDLVDQLRRVLLEYQGGVVSLESMISRAQSYTHELTMRRVPIASMIGETLFDIEVTYALHLDYGDSELTPSEQREVNDRVSWILDQLKDHPPCWSNTPEVR